MLSCREASRLASDGLDRKLAWPRRLALRLHLLMCSGCRAYRLQLLLLDRLVRRDFSRGGLRPTEGKEALSQEARERIKAALRRSRS